MSKNINLSLLKQELKDSQVVALFNSKQTDAESRIIYNTIDNDLYLKHQELPERFSDLVLLESAAADDILQQVINGEAIVHYMIILVDEKVASRAYFVPRFEIIPDEN